MPNELTKNERDDLLLELQDSKFWPAVLSLIDERVALAWSALATQDPFKNPTETARTQGQLYGFSLFTTEIKAIMDERKQREKEEVEK